MHCHVRTKLCVNISSRMISIFIVVIIYLNPCFVQESSVNLLEKNKKLSYTRTKEVLVSRIKEFNSVGNYGLHSFRAGGASAAANQNVLDRCWKRHGS